MTVQTGFPQPIFTVANKAEPEFLTEPEIERRDRENLYIVLNKTGWKIKGADGAAELLGVKPTTLISRIKKMGLKKPDQHSPGGAALNC
jgi:transcriptional regulator with GAF, ATPase, and Fis domain